jgi:predicted O-linked N-acetylglucosamine transferase (SPINDLY family)
VVDASLRPFFDEALLLLPSCFFPVSPLGSLAAVAQRPTRKRAGLPEDRPVLCSFNGPAKLDPPTFDAWTAILRRVPAAVLWLFDGGSPRLRANLRREAAARGVEPERLVFAGKVPYPEHLERYRLADLFLDSFTYSGGATVVDALRRGLPVLTRLGEAPMGRMGASVVRAAGLGELAAASSTAYVELAVEMLGCPDRLREFTERATRAREAAPLFDLAAWVRDYQRGLEAVWNAACEGRRLDIDVAEEH